jgi:hypothetical protein
MRLIGVLVAVCLLLTGCAAAAPPVTAAERAHIRTVLLDQQWAQISRIYPDAVRPTTPVTHTVPDHDWPLAVVNCLHALGYIAQVQGDSFTFDSFTSQSNRDFHVAGYGCTSEYVKQSDVEALLTPRQQQAFDDFEVYQVQPCLRLAGAKNFLPPVGHLTGLSSWSPFQLVWLNGPAKAAAYLELKCPPTPYWMDLASG